MIPGDVPEELKDLNRIEQAAIKLICPMMMMYKRKSGSVVSRGHTIAFEQNVSKFAVKIKSLPLPPNELPIVILESPGSNDTRKFYADRGKILAALQWLKRHNEDYKDIQIDTDKLSQYPCSYDEPVTSIRTLEYEEKDLIIERTVLKKIEEQKLLYFKLLAGRFG